MEYEFKRIPFDAIRSKADEARTRLKEQKIPVDIEKLIEVGYGMAIIPLDFLKSESDIEGFLSNDMTAIYVDAQTYNDERFASRLRFTLAHELGHKLLHADFYRKVEFKNIKDWFTLIDDLHPEDLDWYERHANEFAGRLLVPIDGLVQDLKDLQNQINSLCERAKEAGFKQDEIKERLLGFISARLAPKYKVAPKTIELRIRKERLTYFETE